MSTLPHRREDRAVEHVLYDCREFRNTIEDTTSLVIDRTDACEGDRQTLQKTARFLDRAISD